MSDYNTEIRRQHRLGQISEHGRWVATEQIEHQGVLAYGVGDSVPTSNVTLHGYDKVGVVRETDEYRELVALMESDPYDPTPVRKGKASKTDEASAK